MSPKVTMKMRGLARQVECKRQGQSKLDFSRTLTMSCTFALDSQPTHFHRHLGALLYYLGLDFWTNSDRLVRVLGTGSRSWYH